MKKYSFLMLIGIVLISCTVNESESGERDFLPSNEITLENSLEESQANRFLNESLHKSSIARLEKHGLSKEEAETFLRDSYHIVITRSEQSRDAIYALYETHKNATKEVIQFKVDSINRQYGFDQIITDQKSVIDLMGREIDKMIIDRFGE